MLITFATQRTFLYAGNLDDQVNQTLGDPRACKLEGGEIVFLLRPRNGPRLFLYAYLGSRGHSPAKRGAPQIEIRACILQTVIDMVVVVMRVRVRARGDLFQTMSWCSPVTTTKVACACCYRNTAWALKRTQDHTRCSRRQTRGQCSSHTLVLIGATTALWRSGLSPDAELERAASSCASRLGVSTGASAGCCTASLFAIFA